jgi:hypothetical protein
VDVIAFTPLCLVPAGEDENPLNISIHVSASMPVWQSISSRSSEEAQGIITFL